MRLPAANFRAARWLAAPLLLAFLAAACSEADPVASAPAARSEPTLGPTPAMIAAWPKAPSYAVSFDALHPLGQGSAAASRSLGAQFDPDDDYWGLPRTDGYEQVAAFCSGCHSMALVMQQRHSRERWAYLLQWMVDEQNMVALPDEEEGRVLDYLTEHFGG